VHRKLGSGEALSGTDAEGLAGGTVTDVAG
jgi:hypothetical protein